VAKIRVKICCIQDVEEANMALRYGASALGLVSKMPSGPGPLPEERIAEIAATIPQGIDTFLLTSKQDPEDIIAQQRRTGVNTLQIVDVFPIEGYSILRRSLHEVKIVQVIHVRDAASIEEAKRISEHVHALLLDSGNPNLPTKELGGTGRIHDWEISRKIREAVDIPVYLAGGLSGSNVAKAIALVEPFGVDVCSGVRTNGKLDEAKLASFFRGVLKG